MVISIQKLIPLSKQNVQEAAETLASAFEDFPLFTFLLPEKRNRLEKLKVIFEGYVRHGLRYGQVYATSLKHEGVAVLYNYEEINTSLFAYFRCGMFKFIRKLGLKDSLRFVKITDYMLELHEKKMVEPHWYIGPFGVDPLYQRKGYGTFLVNEIVKITKNENWPYYLETNKEENVDFWRRFGFEVVELGIIPKSDVKNWCMIKRVN